MLGVLDVVDGSAVIVQTVMIAVFGVEADLNRDHEIDGGDQRRHIGKKGRHVILRRAEEQSFCFCSYVGIPHDDQMRKHSHDHKQTRQREGKEGVHPF